MRDERGLIAALRRRDQSALTQVFEQYADKIYRLAISVLHDEAQADGVVQDTFIVLIEHIDRFEERASIGTWLYRVAYNEAAGRLRRIRPQVAIDTIDEEVFPGVFVDWQNIPETVINSLEVAEQMQTAITQLSPALRAVFTLRDIEGLSTQETAASLGISESAVKVRLHRARLNLRESLASYFEEYVQS